MKKVFTKINILIILGALLIALPVELVFLNRSQETFVKEAEDEIEYAIDSAGNDLDMVFNSMSNLVNMLHATVKVTFSGEDYINDRDTFEDLKKQTGDIIKYSLENTEHISGLYVTFAPNLHTGQEEVWYAYKDGKVQYIDARVLSPSWLVEGNPRVDFYYEAIEDGVYWGGPLYDSSLMAYMTSHTRSVYDDDGNLIGTVGSDMLMTEIHSFLNSMKIYEDSQMVLYDDKMNYCSTSENMKKPEMHFSSLKDMISKSESKGRPIWYEAPDGQKHIAAYTVLNNGWILATTQPSSTVMTSATETIRTLMFAMAVTIILIIALVIVLLKRIYGSVIESAEQNEILLINQSRQAKLGEMIGNISHQCKQPLNSMNIAISNMKDDFYADELTKERFLEYEHDMRENVSLMSNTITDFADFLKPDRKQEEFYIKDSVEKALSIMKEKIVLNEITVINEVDENLSVTNFRNEFVQCVFNILDNARAEVVASGIRPRVIRIYSDMSGRDGRVRLNVFNVGRNIKWEDMDKIFKPYYSTKEKDGGTGIGLYLAKQIIEDHFDGMIYCNNNENGVTFTIEIKANEKRGDRNGHFERT